MLIKLLKHNLFLALYLTDIKHYSVSFKNINNILNNNNLTKFSNGDKAENITRKLEVFFALFCYYVTTNYNLLLIKSKSNYLSSLRLRLYHWLDTLFHLYHCMHSRKDIYSSKFADEKIIFHIAKSVYLTQL